MDFQAAIKEAIEVLQSGGVILCPTDTIWGLSADALNPKAVQTVFDIKERPSNKSMIVLVSSMAMLKNYVEKVPTKAIEIIEQSTQPTTVIYQKSKGLATNVAAKDGSIGIRIVKDDFCKQLIEAFERPIISTSANISGESSPQEFKDIDPRIFSRVTHCVTYPEKEKVGGEASAIFLVKGETVEQLR